jgi:DNA-directed RNA polymerase sigma subunit (sigma70/sigma32)
MEDDIAITDNFSNDIEDKIDVEALCEVIDSLQARWAFIIRCLNGIDCEQQSLRQVGKIMNRSHEWVNKNYKRALRRLRSMLT